MDNKEKSTTLDQILEKIKGDKVKMHSKHYFILELVAIILAIVAAVLLSLYLFSFTLFSLRQNGIWYLSGFGLSGVKASLFLIPWTIIFVVGLLVAGIEFLSRKFSFSYRRPVIYSIGGIILIVILGSFLIDKGTSLHPKFMERANEGRLPIGARGFYESFGVPKGRDVHLGEVLEIEENIFQLRTRKREPLRVIVTTKTIFPEGRDIKINDTVIVLGRCNKEGTIKAVGVKKVHNMMIPCYGNLCEKKMYMK